MHTIITDQSLPAVRSLYVNHMPTLGSFTVFHEFLRQYKVGAQCIKILAQVRTNNQFKIGTEKKTKLAPFFLSLPLLKAVYLVLSILVWGVAFP